MAAGSLCSVRVLSIAVLFGLGLPAQEQPPEPEKAKEQQQQPVEQNVERSPLIHHCSGLVMTHPQPLEPGKSGSLFIVVALQNQAVILGNAALELTYEGKQGVLELGSWKARPARPAKLYPFYSGQLVYEDTLTIEIPVTVDAAAKTDGEQVTLELEAELHDGRTGTSIVKGKLPVAGRVMLGRPIGSARVLDASGANVGSVSSKHHEPAAGQPGADGAFALEASDHITVKTAGSARLLVRLAIPAGSHLAKNDDLRVPRFELEGAGDGVRLEAGPQPPTRTMNVEGGDPIEVYDGDYRCDVTVRADATAATGVRNATLKLFYATGDASGARRAPASVDAPLAIEVVAGGPSGQMAAPIADEDAVIEADEAAGPLPVSGGGDLTSFLLVGGGASLLILLVILLLARRK